MSFLLINLSRDNNHIGGINILARLAYSWDIHLLHCCLVVIMASDWKHQGYTTVGQLEIPVVEEGYDSLPADETDSWDTQIMFLS